MWYLTAQSIDGIGRRGRIAQLGQATGITILLGDIVLKTDDFGSVLVHQGIRASGKFDDVIDFDTLARDASLARIRLG